MPPTRRLMAKRPPRRTAGSICAAVIRCNPKPDGLTLPEITEHARALGYVDATGVAAFERRARERLAADAGRGWLRTFREVTPGRWLLFDTGWVR